MLEDTDDTLQVSHPHVTVSDTSNGQSRMKCLTVCKIILLLFVHGRCMSQSPPPVSIPSQSQPSFTYNCQDSPSLGCGPCLVYRKTQIAFGTQIHEYQCLKCQEDLEPRRETILSNGQQFVDIGRMCPLPKTNILAIVLGTVIPVICYCGLLYVLYRCCYKKTARNKVGHEIQVVGISAITRPLEDGSLPLRPRNTESENRRYMSDAEQTIGFPQDVVLGAQPPPITSICIAPQSKAIIKKPSFAPKPRPYKPTLSRIASFSDLEAASNLSLKRHSDKP